MQLQKKGYWADISPLRPDRGSNPSDWLLVTQSDYIDATRKRDSTTGKGTNIGSNTFRATICELEAAVKQPTSSRPARLVERIG